MHSARLFSPMRGFGKGSWESKIEAESGRMKEDVRLFPIGKDILMIKSAEAVTEGGN